MNAYNKHKHFLTLTTITLLGGSDIKNCILYFIFFCIPHWTCRLMVSFYFCDVNCIMTHKHGLDARLIMKLAILIITCCYKYNG